MNTNEEKEKRIFVVLDETGEPIYSASWEEACHEHINDAINEFQFEGAEKWRVVECVALRDAIRAALRAALRAESEPVWISVADRLPEPNTDCIVYMPGRGSVMVCKYFNTWSLIEVPSFGAPDITHWMPLPTAPQTEPKVTGSEI